jgi:hypothetical protein
MAYGADRRVNGALRVGLAPTRMIQRGPLPVANLNADRRLDGIQVTGSTHQEAQAMKILATTISLAVMTLLLESLPVRPASAGVVTIEATAPVTGEGRHAVRTATMIAVGRAIDSAHGRKLAVVAFHPPHLKNGAVTVALDASDESGAFTTVSPKALDPAERESTTPER